MRLTEIILITLITTFPLYSGFLKNKTHPVFSSLSVVILLLVHFFLEGWRWPLIPIYSLALVTCIFLFRNNQNSRKKTSILKRIGGLFWIIIGLISGFASYAFPVFNLPEPSGPFQVSTKSIVFESDREESITNDSTDFRRFLIKVWYPSDVQEGEAEQDVYIDSVSRANFAMKYGLPPSTFDYLDYIDTHTFKEAPFADGTFPVLFFSHGYGSKAEGYYSILAEIASHGYVIFNMNHTYESLGTLYPDGTSARFDYDYQSAISQNSMDYMGEVIEAFRNDLAFEERHPIVRKAALGFYEETIQSRWAHDIIDVIDTLGYWNKEGWLANKLDLERIGVFGHSVGGGAIGNAALKDSRIKVAANLDGNQWGAKIDTTYKIPYLYVSADWPASHEDINAHIYLKKSEDVFYEAKLLDSGHPNFMDIPFMIPIQALAGTGMIDPYLGIEITNQLLLSFFDVHLKRINTTKVNDVGNLYNELQLKVYEPN